MERVLANKVNYLAKHGYEITIVTTDQKDRKSYFQMDSTVRHIDLGINYTDDLDKGFLVRIGAILTKNILHKRRLKQVLNKVSPDITISMFDNDASFITNFKDGSKKVLEIHFSRYKRLQYGRRGIWKLIDSFQNKLDIYTVKKFDRFIVLTEEDKGYWGNLSNIEVIPNANSFETESQASLENNQILAIGRLDYQKGFDNLLHIWSKINHKFPNWKLNIYGKGPLKSDLQNLIKSLNLHNSVSLNKPVKDVRSIYKSHSILVLTSRYEGLPMVLLEAQVCGLPVVSFACKCGPRDIIRDGINGFLIPEANFDLFAHKLGILMGDESLRKKMGNQAFENSERFSVNGIMKKWIELFNSILK